jgi:hypothetical protein
MKYDDNHYNTQLFILLTRSFSAGNIYFTILAANIILDKSHGVLCVYVMLRWDWCNTSAQQISDIQMVQGLVVVDTSDYIFISQGVEDDTF